MVPGSWIAYVLVAAVGGLTFLALVTHELRLLARTIELRREWELDRQAREKARQEEGR